MTQQSHMGILVCSYKRRRCMEPKTRFPSGGKFHSLATPLHEHFPITQKLWKARNSACFDNQSSISISHKYEDRSLAIEIMAEDANNERKRGKKKQRADVIIIHGSFLQFSFLRQWLSIGIHDFSGCYFAAVPNWSRINMRSRTIHIVDVPTSRVDCVWSINLWIL